MSAKLSRVILRASLSYRSRADAWILSGSESAMPDLDLETRSSKEARQRKRNAAGVANQLRNHCNKQKACKERKSKLERRYDTGG